MSSDAADASFDDRCQSAPDPDYRRVGAVSVRYRSGMHLRPGPGGGALVVPGPSRDVHGQVVRLDVRRADKEGLAVWLGFAGATWDARSGVRLALEADAIQVSIHARRVRTLPRAVWQRPDASMQIEVSVVRTHTVSVAVNGRTQASFYVGADALSSRGGIALEPRGAVHLTRVTATREDPATAPSFVVRDVVPVQHRPYFVTSEDLDADGRQDLLVTNRGTLEGQSANTTISVMYGAEDGGFAPPRHCVVGKGPYTIEAADVTGDGVRDLLVASFYEWTGRDITVLSGAALNAERRTPGAGAHALYVDSARRHAAVAARDLTLDAGKGYVMAFDVVCMKGTSLYVWVALRATSLSDRTGALVRLAPDKTVLFTREADADWRERAVPSEGALGPGDRVACLVHGRRLEVRVNDAVRASFDCAADFRGNDGRIPDGTVGWQVSGPRREIGIDNLRITSVDGKDTLFEDDFDADPKARYVDLGGNARRRHRRTLARPASDRTFVAVPRTKPVSAKRSRWPVPGATSLVVRDFDGDGALDFATVAWTSDALHVFRGDGKGTFRLHASYADDAIGLGLRDVRAADLDGDGTLDLAITCYTSNHVAVFRGKGDGTFRFRHRYPSGGTTAYHLAIADLNGDQRPDLVVGNYSGEVRVLLHTGRGLSFRDGGTYRRFGLAARHQNEIRDVLAHDVDGDGAVDLLLACASPHAGFVAVLYGTGQRSPGKLFARVEHVYLGQRPRSLWLRDLDADGRADLAVVRHDADDVLILDGPRAPR